MSRRTPNLLLAVLAFVPVALVAQASCVAVAGDAGTTVSLPFGKDVDVAVAGQQWRLRFADVHDSRCPARVTCVWAGVAEVTVHVTPLLDGRNAPRDVALALPGDPQTAFGAVFTLDSLDPRPATDGTPQPYVASVRIRQAAK